DILLQKATGRRKGSGGEAIRRRRGIGIEGWVVDALSARPEAGARAFVRVGIELDRSRHIGHGTARRERRRLATREPRHRQVETSPEEMHRAALADERRSKRMQH